MHIVCPSCHKTNRAPTDKPLDQALCGSCGQVLFDGKPVEIDLLILRRHIERNDIPVLVDFWAPWCAPCRMMAPAFAEAAGHLKTTVRLAKVNTEEHQQAGSLFAIRSIPTMVLFAGGQELGRVSGAMNATQIQHWVSQQLAH